jgi:uncharacterized membrane protein
MAGLFLIASTFLASAVEMVEALTIVLATGVTRGWRSALLGAGAALVALAALVVVVGPAVATLIPTEALRLVIGLLLLIFGLQWLRKAILRAAGLKAKHDEEAIFRAEVAALRDAGGVEAGAVDWPGFVVSFKGVFLEGLEVAFIVVTFGGSAGNIPLAAAGALLALALVGVGGAVAHRPLSRVPENALKFAVGLVLTAFGVFWAGEGVGIDWPGGELMLLALFAGFGALSWVLVMLLDRRRVQAALPRPGAMGGDR